MQKRRPERDSGLAFPDWLRYQPRMAKESIEKLASALAESVPEGLRSVRDDLEQNFRAILKGGLDRLDLVTREEFDVQQAVLARTREKLETLESRLADLEEKKTTGTETAKKKVKKKAAKNKAPSSKAARKKVTKKKSA
jgi:BMFP domain-containing protein YqiC